MQTYNIPVIWSCWGILPVTAKSLEDAVKKAKEPNVNLPATSEYLDDSFMVEDDLGSLEMHNTSNLTSKDKKFLKIK